MNGGSTANKNGKYFENIVEDFIISKGYQNNIYNEKSYQKQFIIGENIYNRPYKIDFLIKNGKNNIIIECKYQQTSGSVDEKYPFLYYNLIKIGLPSLILIDGNGYRKMAKEWLKNMIDNKILLHVWSFNEFKNNFDDIWKSL